MKNYKTSSGLNYLISKNKNVYSLYLVKQEIAKKSKKQEEKLETYLTARTFDECLDYLFLICGVVSGI